MSLHMLNVVTNKLLWHVAYVHSVLTPFIVVGDCYSSVSLK